MRPLSSCQSSVTTETLDSPLAQRSTQGINLSISENTLISQSISQIGILLQNVLSIAIQVVPSLLFFPSKFSFYSFWRKQEKFMHKMLKHMHGYFYHWQY